MNQVNQKTEKRRGMGAQPERPLWRMRLYLADHGPKSAAAIVDLKKICSEQLNDRYCIDVVDPPKEPGAAGENPLAASPTLVCVFPGAIKDFESLSDLKRVLDRLDWPLFHRVELRPGGRRPRGKTKSKQNGRDTTNTIG